MEDIVIANPIDPSVSGGAVANSPPKAPIPPIRERILGPSSQYPLVKNVLVKTAISRPTYASKRLLARSSSSLPKPPTIPRRSVR
jgi:hypothetical protein